MKRNAPAGFINASIARKPGMTVTASFRLRLDYPVPSFPPK